MPSRFSWLIASPFWAETAGAITVHSGDDGCWNLASTWAAVSPTSGASWFASVCSLAAGIWTGLATTWSVSSVIASTDPSAAVIWPRRAGTGVVCVCCWVASVR
jgi:hypothetical protein